jgi:hypothetical protein
MTNVDERVCAFPILIPPERLLKHNIIRLYSRHVIIEPPPNLTGSVIDKRVVVPAFSILAVMHYYRVQVIRRLFLLNKGCIDLFRQLLLLLFELQLLSLCLRFKDT